MEQTRLFSIFRVPEVVEEFGVQVESICKLFTMRLMKKRCHPQPRFQFLRHRPTKRERERLTLVGPYIRALTQRVWFSMKRFNDLHPLLQRIQQILNRGSQFFQLNPAGDDAEVLAFLVDPFFQGGQLLPGQHEVPSLRFLHRARRRLRRHRRVASKTTLRGAGRSGCVVPPGSGSGDHCWTGPSLGFSVCLSVRRTGSAEFYRILL